MNNRKECYGIQDAQMAENFPHDCNKCKDREECFDKTIRAICESIKNMTDRGEI